MLWYVYLILSAVVLLALYLQSTYAICRSRKRLDGMTALVTGSTAGMGLQIAKDFANRGARVIIACPFEREGIRVRKHIIEKTGNNEVIFKLLDLSSIASVRKFANEVINEEKRLNILVNNAGVCLTKDYITGDDLSSTMQINYFGHFLLTLLLLPLLKKSGECSEPSRIINVTSLAHVVGKIDFGTMNDRQHWTLFGIYANSKLCLILFTRELAKKLKGSNVVVNSADPGVVTTYIFSPENIIFRIIIYTLVITMRILLKSPWQGAQNAIHVAVDVDAGKVSGEMFSNCMLSKASTKAYDEDLASKLWHESVKLVGLSTKEAMF